MYTYFTTVPTEVFDAIGIMGFGLYVLNYTLLTFQRLSSASITFFAINWMAATFVLIGLTTSFNLASALIQIFWIGISTVAIFIRLCDRDEKPMALRTLGEKLAR